MKYGIITDIHSNNIALNKVFEEFDKRKVNKIICCGDIIGIGPFPEECVQELIKKKDMLICVRGNHENYLINGLPESVHNDKRTMSIEEINNHKRNGSKLTRESIEFIKDLPIYQYINDGKILIYAIHYPLNENNEYMKHIKLPSFDECEELFNGINCNVILYGHTHTINIKNSENNRWYINSGSLGCPMETDVANYGILTVNDDIVKMEFLKIKYNVNEIRKNIKEMNYPDSDKILKVFYGEK